MIIYLILLIFKDIYTNKPLIVYEEAPRKQNTSDVPSIHCGILYLCIIAVTETFSVGELCWIQLKGAAWLVPYL